MKALSLSLAALCLVSVASAESLREKVEKMNKEIHAAFLKSDIAMFVRVTKPHMTADFKYFENGQTMNYDQMVAQMKAGFVPGNKVTVAKTEILSMTEKGNAGAGKSRHTMMMVSKGPDKKQHTMMFQGISTDTFRKEGGVWKMATMNMKTEKMLMDGKPMPMAAPKSGGR